MGILPSSLGLAAAAAGRYSSKIRDWGYSEAERLGIQGIYPRFGRRALSKDGVMR